MAGPRKNKLSKQPGNPAQSAGFWIWLIFFAAILIIPAIFPAKEQVKELSWLDFKAQVLSKKAAEKIVIVNQDYADVYLKPSVKNDAAFKDVFKPTFGNEPNPGPHYRIVIASAESFEKKLDDAELALYKQEIIPVTYVKKNSGTRDIFTWIIIMAVFMILWQYLLRRVSTGDASTFDFGKSTAMLWDRENESNITFADVAGLEEAEMEVREIVEFLKSPENFTRLGAKIPKGIILVGAPGTGKTLLAKAVAGEAKVPFFSISGSEFVEMFVGVGASRVRDLFKKAKEKAPCIIFIDEIDAIGRSRSRNSLFTGANDERESTLNQLLTEMDGFGTNSGVIVLAATNRADMLDPALLRPGRFDRHIYLELPNIKEREAIFGVHLKPLVFDSSIDVHFLAAQTPGFSGADIANICNEAALIAARHNSKMVSRPDFMEAIDRVVAGLEKKSKIITPEEKRMVAYHEAGHALVSWLLKTVDPLVKVSIIPRGKSLGASWYLPEEKQLRTYTAFKEHLCATLAGRAAEEITFHEPSSGALDDLEKVTKEAYMMVAYYGFDSKVGAVSFYDSTGQRENGFQKPYSEETGKLIDEQVRQLLNNAYMQAKQLLVQHNDALIKIAELLLQKEVIYKEDLQKILGNRLPTDLSLPPATTSPALQAL